MYLITLLGTAPSFCSFSMKVIAETMDDIIQLRDYTGDEKLKQELTRYIDTGKTGEFFYNTPLIQELPAAFTKSSVEGEGFTYRYTNIWDYESDIQIGSYQAEILYVDLGSGYYCRAVKVCFDNLAYIIPERLREAFIDPRISCHNAAHTSPGLNGYGVFKVVSTNNLRIAYSPEEITNRIASHVFFVESYFDNEAAVILDSHNPRPIDFSIFFAELLGD